MLKINHSNWTTSYFKASDLKVFISLVAEPSHKDEKLVDTFYALTVTNTDGEEMFQECFNDLDECIQTINERYEDFKLIEMAKTLNDGDGCSSCAAH